MDTEEPGAVTPSPEPTPEKAFDFRHFAIGLSIHVTGIVLLQAFGLHGMLAHIMVATVWQCLEQTRRLRG